MPENPSQRVKPTSIDRWSVMDVVVEFWARDAIVFVSHFKLSPGVELFWSEEEEEEEEES